MTVEERLTVLEGQVRELLEKTKPENITRTVASEISKAFRSTRRGNQGQDGSGKYYYKAHINDIKPLDRVVTAKPDEV